MSNVADDEKSARRCLPEVDHDQVDFSWLPKGLRRLGLLGPPRPSPAEQLTFFGPEVVRPRQPIWWPVRESGTASTDRVLPGTITADPRARLLLVVAVVGYVVVFLRWSFRQQDGLGTLAFDLGIFDQGVWLLSQLRSPFVTINGRNLFGDHTSFILLPWAAVYRVFPSAKVLLTGQTLALGLGAWPTFLIARDKLRSEMLAALLGVAYLLQPVVGWANLSENFHPDAFEIPLVLFAIWFLLRHRWVGYWICVAALLLVKEDVALLTFGLGVYVALRHDRRVGWITCGVSAAYFVCAFWLIIPGFLGAGTVYAGRVPFGGPTGFLKETMTHPSKVIASIATKTRAWYLWQLFVPLGLVSWWAPGVLLIAIGPLVLNLISQYGYQFDVRYHYSTLILPIIVVATIFGIASRRRQSHAGIVAAVVAASLVCAYLWSPTPIGRVHPYIANPDSSTVASFHRAERLLPSGAVVSAYYGYIAQIAHRDEVYMFPNPWKASYWGTFKQEGQRLPQADRVQYLMVPTQLGPESQAVLDNIRSQFDSLYDTDGVQLLKRRS